MATLSQSAPAMRSEQPGWFWKLLESELAPYPGRAGVVTRMVISAVIVAVLIMTFRIPAAALSAYYTLLIPRDNPQAALRASIITIVACALGTAEVLMGAMLFLDSPFTHFLFVIGSLFIAFFVIHVVRIYSGANAFGFVVTIGIATWDRLLTPNRNVEATLFTFWAIAIGCAVTVAIEYLFHSMRGGDYVFQGITERLRVVASTLQCLVEEQQADRRTERKLAQYAMIGTGQLRQMLASGNYPRIFSTQLGAVISLSGRLIDLTVAVKESRFRPGGEDLERVRRLIAQIDAMRARFARQETPELLELTEHGTPSPTLPLLPELERVVSLISQAFAGIQNPSTPLPAPGAGRNRIFEADAFSNPEHMKFALRGVLAAAFCYIAYTGVGWPGLSVALPTCVLTAFSNVGTSRQRQVLRISGALIGGCIFGFGSQIFLLPHMDSVVQFAVLFAVVTWAAAWVATSSPRLSYAGFQIALAYDLVNLGSFTVNTSLVVARDRVIGNLLGLIAMWLIFDQLWSTPAGEEMMKLFIKNMRLIAHFPRRAAGYDPEASHALRDEINSNFNAVRSLSDAVLFEFGESRTRDLVNRRRVRTWQPELRSLFILKVALNQQRMRTPDLALPPQIEHVEQEAGIILEHLASYLETPPQAALPVLEEVSPVLLAEETVIQAAPHAPSVASISHSLMVVTQFFYEDVRAEITPPGPALGADNVTAG